MKILIVYHTTYGTPCSSRERLKKAPSHGWTVWYRGHWAVPPYPNAVWVPGCWMAVPRGYYRVPGHWQ